MAITGARSLRASSSPFIKWTVPGTGGPADGHRLAGETGVGDGREGTEFLVADMDEVNRAIASQRIDHRVQRVTHDAITAPDPSGHEHLPHSVGNGLGHWSLLPTQVRHVDGSQASEARMPQEGCRMV